MAGTHPAERYLVLLPDSHHPNIFWIILDPSHNCNPTRWLSACLSLFKDWVSYSQAGLKLVT